MREKNEFYHEKLALLWSRIEVIDAEKKRDFELKNWGNLELRSFALLIKFNIKWFEPDYLMKLYCNLSEIYIKFIEL